MRKPNDVTETELAILDVLWEQGPIAVREIADALYGAHRRSLPGTHERRCHGPWLPLNCRMRFIQRNPFRGPSLRLSILPRPEILACPLRIAFIAS